MNRIFVTDSMTDFHAERRPHTERRPRTRRRQIFVFFKVRIGSDCFGLARFGSANNDGSLSLRLWVSRRTLRDEGGRITEPFA